MFRHSCGRDPTKRGWGHMAGPQRPPGHGLQPHPKAVTIPELTSFPHSPTRAQGGRLSPRPSADQEEPPSNRRAKAR